MNAMDVIPYEEDSFYIFDRGYNDFQRLFRINVIGAYFIVRGKKNNDFKPLKWKRRFPPGSGILSDAIGYMNSEQTRFKYPEKIRRITYWDHLLGRRAAAKFIFFTNALDISPMMVSELYHNRWQIELFFKWLKQHLKIKKFWGESENAVRIQIHTAITPVLAAHTPIRLKAAKIVLFCKDEIPDIGAVGANMKEFLSHHLLSRLTLPPPDAMTSDNLSATKMHILWRISKFRQTGARESAADGCVGLVTVRQGPKSGCGARQPAPERRLTGIRVRQFGGRTSGRRYKRASENDGEGRMENGEETEGQTDKPSGDVRRQRD